MPQALHIFGKDARRFWPEILVSWAALALYGYYEPRQWYGRVFEHPLLYFLAPAISFLVPLAWAFLIVRVVQADSLVGNTQFWVTKPYQWAQLLLSKLLFVAVFIALPYLLADVVLLRVAGFPVRPYMGLLLAMELGIATVLFLPSFVLATLSSTVVRAALGLVIVILGLIGIGLLSEKLPGTYWGPYRDEVIAFLVIGACVAAAIWQYARRRTVASRSLIAGVVLLSVAAGFIGPTKPSLDLAKDHQPLDWEHAPMRLTLDPKLPEEPKISGANEKNVAVNLPLLVSGIAETDFIRLDGVAVSVAQANNAIWHSSQPTWGLLMPGQKRMTLRFEIPAAVFEQVQATPVTLRVEVGYRVLREAQEMRVTVPPHEFELENGICSLEEGEGVINCRAPLSEPKTDFALRLRPADSACQTNSNAANLDQPMWAYESGREGSWVQLGFSPVRQYFIWFRYPEGSVDGEHAGRTHRIICPGTSLVLTHPREIAKNRSTLEIPDLVLKHYRQSSWSGPVGAGSVIWVMH
jgi:hypothetical protein